MMYDEELALKQQLAQLTAHGDKIFALHTKVSDYHK